MQLLLKLVPKNEYQISTSLPFPRTNVCWSYRLQRLVFQQSKCALHTLGKKGRHVCSFCSQPTITLLLRKCIKKKSAVSRFSSTADRTTKQANQKLSSIIPSQFQAQGQNANLNPHMKTKTYLTSLVAIESHWVAVSDSLTHGKDRKHPRVPRLLGSLNSEQGRTNDKEVALAERRLYDTTIQQRPKNCSLPCHPKPGSRQNWPRRMREG